MKVAALKNTDRWFGRVQQAINAREMDAVMLRGLPAEAVVDVDSVTIMNDGPERGHRPWLQISGTLSSLRMEVELPYGITELAFDDQDVSTPMDYRFDFSDEELAEAVLSKGLFHGTFAAPERMAGIQWELPANLDALVIGPDDMDSPPLVFVEIHDQNSQQVDAESSGYVGLLDYFPEHVPGTEPMPVAATRQVSRQSPGMVRVRTGEIADLFAGEELHLGGDDVAEEFEATGSGEQESAGRATVSSAKTVFERMVAEATRRREEAEAKARAEMDELDPTNPEKVYAERVAGDLEEALQPVEPEPEQDLVDGDLLTDEELNLDAQPDQDEASGPDAEEIARAVDEAARREEVRDHARRAVAEESGPSGHGDNLEFD